jgi:hypothetical protein
MIELVRCPQCPGFLQASSSRCPHCDAAARPAPSRLGRGMRALLAIAGTGSMALTLMACYGSPCAGSNDCYEPDLPDLSVGVDLAAHDLAEVDDVDGGTHDLAEVDVDGWTHD